VNQHAIQELAMSSRFEIITRVVFAIVTVTAFTGISASPAKGQA
jgi:hypothetical protein